MDQGGGSGEGGGNNRCVDSGDEDRETPGSHWGLLGIALTFVSSTLLTVSRSGIATGCYQLLDLRLHAGTLQPRWR